MQRTHAIPPDHGQKVKGSGTFSPLAGRYLVLERLIVGKSPSK
jgi:hypothetical protein